MREQANAFRKYRDADDVQGNLAWAARVGSKALCVGPEAASRDVEGIFEFDELEKIIWRLLKLPRRYTELEHSGLFDADNLRGVLRGLVAADVVDIVDSGEAKALLPAEIRRLKAEVQGKEWRPKVGTLAARVYRPDLDGAPSSPSGAAVTSAPPPSASSSSSKVSTKPTFEVLLTPDEKRLKEQFLTAVKAMGGLNHYQFLGVQQVADDGAIRAAYVHLAREYHPDKIAGGNLENDAEAKDAADALFKRLGEAHKAIGTAEARARYDRELALSSSSTTTGERKRPRRPVEARNAYLMAETFLKKKEFKQAEVHYRQAAMFDPDEPIIQAALAWCIYLNTDSPLESRLAEARKRLEELLKSARTGDVFYKYGRVLRDLGDEGGALRAFEKAVALTPGHTDAQREVRLAQARREKEAQAKAHDKSLLGKLNKILNDR
jgi:curved DNA-binding protein CbpA